MKTGKSLTSLIFVAALCALSMPSPSQAQVSIYTGDDCRCVDANGEEIENCICYRTPDESVLAWQYPPFGGSRARIGITLSVTVSDDDSRGARVESVMEDGPADRAGLREGDLITHIDGHSLLQALEDREAEDAFDLDGSIPSQRLLELARELEPGDEVEVRFSRDGESRTVTMVAEDLDDWGGNFRFYGGNWEEAWDAEEFQDQWREYAETWKEHAENWEEYAEGWEDAKQGVIFRDGSVFRFRAPGGDDEVVFWNREDAPFSVYERFFDEADPKVYAFGPEGGQFEIAHGGWPGFGDYLTACPGFEGEEGNYVLGGSCIGGLQLEAMNEGLGEYFGTAEGVLVADVHSDSKLGIQPGDVILQVGEREVSGVGALRRILRSYDADEEVTLHIMRDRQRTTVTGTLGR